MPFQTERIKRLARDVYFNVIGLNKYIFLGCPGHGLTAAEGILYYLENRETNNWIDAIFIEGFFYSAEGGVDLNKITYASDRQLIDNLKTRIKVIGLETDETDPPGLTLSQKQRFGDTQRCNVANRIWRDIIVANTPDALNSRSIICCGAAHLVDMLENGAVVSSLQTGFDPIDYEVFHCTNGDLGQFHGVEGRSNPNELLKVLPSINEYLDEDSSPSGSDSD